jgi:hydroxyacylglutathione hydrolase
MFHAGCGRLFEGTPAQMVASLASLVAEGDAARVYPGHEYTVQNLRFAQSVEPGNCAVADALIAAKALRDAGKPTVGTTIAKERETNPFVRTPSPEIRACLGIDPAADDATALAAIRAAKNAFL